MWPPKSEVNYEQLKPKGFGIYVVILRDWSSNILALEPDVVFNEEACLMYAFSWTTG